MAEVEDKAAAAPANSEITESIAKSKIAGIPAWPYPDPADEKSLEEWCKKTTGKNMDDTLRFVGERVNQYSYMKQSLTNSRSALQDQRKELQVNLDILSKLEASEGETLDTTFKLSDP